MTTRVLRRWVLVPLLAATLAVGGLGSGASPVAGFTGYGCTKATCAYFTSSYPGTTYYYKRANCSQWRNLSNSYLRGFKTAAALLAMFPSRKLHKAC